MASASARSISRPNYPSLPVSKPSFTLSPLQFLVPRDKFQSRFKSSDVSCSSSWVESTKRSFSRPVKVTAMVEEEEASPLPAAAAPDQTVPVSVSHADVLTLFFQAEGTMSDSAVPAVTEALEEVEGITDLKVQVLEGIASVELTKQTTVQATGVASNLVETIQSSGFKLQNLNLSFRDDEDFS